MGIDPIKLALLVAGARSGDEATLDLALQITNSKPCLVCGFINTNCKCNNIPMENNK